MYASARSLAAVALGFEKSSNPVGSGPTSYSQFVYSIEYKMLLTYSVLGYSFSTKSLIVLRISNSEMLFRLFSLM